MVTSISRNRATMWWLGFVANSGRNIPKEVSISRGRIPFSDMS